MTANVAALLEPMVTGKKEDDFVLTRSNVQPVRCFQKSWYQLCVRAGLGWFDCRECGATSVTAKGKLRSRCSRCGGKRLHYRGLLVHDLRRSAAKALRRAGVAESVIQVIGGWKTREMFKRYAIVSSSDQRSAVESLERSCAAISENSRGNSRGSARNRLRTLQQATMKSL